MINRYKNLLLTSLMVLVIISCGENEDLLQFNEADNKITFPDYPAFSASFTSLDVVTMDVAVDGDATSLTVTGADGDDFGTVAIASGTGTFTRTLAELGNPEDETLTFSDGTTVKLFDVTINNPITLEGTTSSQVNLDSTFSIVFSGETENGVIDSYDLFLKNGEQASYPGTPNAEGSGTTTELEDSVAFAAANASYAIGDTIFYRVDYNSGSLTASKSGTIIIKEVALTETGSITLRTPDYLISAAVEDSLRNAYNFKAFKYMADSVLATDIDSADVQLLLNAGELDIATGAGSGTSFVVADGTFSFSSATYESIKTAYDAGTPVTTVGDIESLDDNTVILIELGNIPEPGWASADNRRYAAVQIVDITKDDGGVTSEVTLDFVAPAQPEE